MATQKEMEGFNRLLAAVEEHLRTRRGLHVEYVQVLAAAMEAFGEPNPENLCTRGLTQDALIAKLDRHPFDCPVILGSIEAPDLDIPGGIGRIYAALNRGAGREWEILSYPSDPFPSDPHAHNESEDISMDLATGALYHDRQYVHKLFRKDLAAFRAKISERFPGIALPPLRES